MVLKCFPLELLFEIAPFVPTQYASAPNVLSSCKLLETLLLPRAMKWRKEWKAQTDTKMINNSLKPIELKKALSKGFLHPSTGVFNHFMYVQKPISFGEALRRNFIKLPSTQTTIALTLSDCIDASFIDANTGKFEGVEGQFSLFDAIRCQPHSLLKDDVREIVDMANNRRLTVMEAATAKVLCLNSGRFTNLNGRIEMSLHDAHQRRMIQNPQTLAEVIASESLDNDDGFIDGVKRRTLLEAICSGMLDPDVAHIKTGHDEELISIGEALKRGRLTPEGRIVLSLSEAGINGERQINLNTAYERDLLTNRVRHTIFDVRGVRKATDGSMISFKDALVEEIFLLDDIGLLENKLREASARGEIDSGLAEILVAPCGLSENDQPLSLVHAYAKGLVTHNVPNFFSTLHSAMRLSALLNVHPSLCQ